MRSALVDDLGGDDGGIKVRLIAGRQHLAAAGDPHEVGSQVVFTRHELAGFAETSPARVQARSVQAEVEAQSGLQ